jgi:mannose-6-phosphate isomerase-like protein (cupin superfamily)
MRAFEMRQLLAERERLDGAYFEFLRVPSLNMGVYALAAGAEDEGEKVHPTEDEVHYVLSGRAVLHAGANEAKVRQGDVVFMPAGVEHWVPQHRSTIDPASVFCADADWAFPQSGHESRPHCGHGIA